MENKCHGTGEKKLPYLDAVYSSKLEPCFKCKTPTHWLDIDYQGRVCSQRCQKEIAQDVKKLSQKKLDSPDMVKIAKSNAVGMGLIPPDSPDREIADIIVDYHLEAERALEGKTEHYPSIVEAENEIIALFPDREHPCKPCEYNYGDSGCVQIICPHQITNKKIEEEASTQERKRIRLELEKAYRLNTWIERDEAVSILLQALEGE